MSDAFDSSSTPKDTKRLRSQIIRKILAAVIVGLGVMGSVSAIIHLLWQELEQNSVNLDSVRSTYSTTFFRVLSVPIIVLICAIIIFYFSINSRSRRQYTLTRTPESDLEYAGNNGINVDETKRNRNHNFQQRDQLQHNKSDVRRYRKLILTLTIFTIPFSILTFVSSALSVKISQAIDAGNSLVLQLRTTLGPNFNASAEKLNDYDTLIKTQQLYTTSRALYQTANQIRFTLFGLMPPSPPEPSRIPAGLPNVAETIKEIIPEFQDLRQYGQTGRDLVAVFYGTMSTCVLPIFFALLGVCAKFLRQFEQDIRNQTYVKSQARAAEFTVATIAGAVVGLFNNFTLGQSATIAPLALAFLVGFSVDVVFAFLETTIQTFVKRSEPSTLTKSEERGESAR
jgi:hypothetical protein